MATGRRFGIDAFERAFDQFFDELLIERWKCGTQSAQYAQMFDKGDRYEVRVEAVGVDPAKIQLEVFGQRLGIRVPNKLGGMLESSFAFTDSIEGEGSTATWSRGTLVITIPKRKGRRIALKP